MKQEIISKLIDLNNAFYNEVAIPFNSTRSYSWTGWQQLADYFNTSGFKPGKILDLGCGNGRFLKFAAEHFAPTAYVGLDSNSQLLNFAEQDLKSSYPQVDINLIRHDLFKNPDLSFLKGQFDLIVLLGVMHHIPGKELREAILSRGEKLLKPHGKMVITCWDFLTEQKLSKKLVAWEKVGIAAESVEEHDYVLDWKRDRSGYRYCHFYTDTEITELLKASGLKCLKEFYADGPGNKANRYLLLERLADASEQ